MIDPSSVMHLRMEVSTFEWSPESSRYLADWLRELLEHLVPLMDRVVVFDGTWTEHVVDTRTRADEAVVEFDPAAVATSLEALAADELIGLGYRRISNQIGVGVSYMQSRKNPPMWRGPQRPHVVQVAIAENILSTEEIESWARIFLRCVQDLSGALNAAAGYVTLEPDSWSLPGHDVSGRLIDVGRYIQGIRWAVLLNPAQVKLLGGERPIHSAAFGSFVNRDDGMIRVMPVMGQYIHEISQEQIAKFEELLGPLAGPL